MIDPRSAMDQIEVASHPHGKCLAHSGSNDLTSGIDAQSGLNDLAPISDDRVKQTSKSGNRYKKHAIRLAKKYNLVICFIFAIVIGLTYPAPGVAASFEHGGVRPFSVFCIVLIFFLNGLKLKSREVRSAMQEWHGIAYGASSILVVTVVIGVLIVRGLQDANAFPVDAFGTGMKIFFATPTTLNMGIVVSEQAGGNGAVSLLLTTSCNLIGVFTVPLMLEWLADLKGTGGVDVEELIIKLLYSLFLPCVVGQLVRHRVGFARRFADRWSFQLKIVSSVALACLPWMSVSRARDDGTLSGISVQGVFAVIGYFFLVHTGFIIVNVLGTRLLRISHATAISVIVMASQKTFPVAATIISFLPDDVGDQGLMTVACILCQQSQLVYDSIAAAKYAMSLRRNSDNDDDDDSNNRTSPDDESCTEPVTRSSIPMGLEDDTKNGSTQVRAVTECTPLVPKVHTVVTLDAPQPSQRAHLVLSNTSTHHQTSIV
eukprot:m.321325 g.321325  ORF g.321325 m.321325 type:complete len:487 (+) comp20332_c0_seq3:356-1816(+)